MSEAKNINYHYLQQQSKSDSKGDNLFKKIESVNTTSQLNNILSLNKVTSKTNQYSVRSLETSNSNSKLIPLNQIQSKVVTHNAKPSNNNSSIYNLKDNSANFVSIDSNENIFKRNLRTQSRETNKNNYYKNNSFSSHHSIVNNNTKVAKADNNQSNSLRTLPEVNFKENKVYTPSYSFKNSSLLNNNIFSTYNGSNHKTIENSKTNGIDPLQIIKIKPLSVRELSIESQSEKKAPIADVPFNLNNKLPLNGNSKSNLSDFGPSFNQKGSSVKEFAYKEEQNSRFRPGMEDFYKIVDKYLGDPTKGLFTLYDGHGGPDCARYAKERFPDIFSRCLVDTNMNIKNALTNSFTKLDEEIKIGISENIGSTIAVVYITQETEINITKTVIYTANAGDSRIVLVSKDTVKRLSYDHKCSDYSEINRIRSSGGIIIEGRILGQLILSRAIGDHSLKRFGVICAPHLNRHVITENDRYVVMASDGLWDVINDYDLLKLINNNSNLNLSQLTQFLVKYSLDNGSTDNTSCMILKLS